MNIRMRSMAGALALLAALAVMAGPALAQEDPNLSSAPLTSQSEPPQDAQGAFGLTPQDLWVAATQFQGRLSTTAGDLLYSGFHYYANPGSATPQRYFAQLDLPGGALITGIECHVRDNVANDVLVTLQRYWHEVPPGTNTPSGVIVTQASSTGTTLYQQISTPNIAETVRYTEGNRRNLYYLSADIASDTGLRGCRVRWLRTVSPGPATATFSDVPTTDGRFKFVEALVASGLTSGCGGGLFCPDTAVTRGQLAVFLAGALGMHFPQ
jgi:hypothetical protein